MNTKTRTVKSLSLAVLLTLPAVAYAAPPATSPYATDASNSYVQDQTSRAMDNLNNILCYIHAMDPAEMVNLGNYIALVDRSVCSPNDQGGNGSNTGSSFDAAIVNSTRTDSASDMIAKVWIEGGGGGGGNILARLQATSAPTASNPYGVFRLDYAESKPSSSETGKGFINSSANGLSFFQTSTCGSCINGSSGAETLRLKLDATTQTDGSGALSMKNFDSTGVEVITNNTASFLFAYNTDYFRRSDGTNEQCFSRNLANAKDSVWQYGVYDSSTGARIERNSGFPIEYTDTASGNKMNGYVGYWGASLPTAVTSGITVYKVTYNNNTAPTKTPYTLQQTGGKLTKYTRVVTTLAGVDKIKFQFWPQNTVGSVTMPLNVTPSTLSSGTGYEAYWDSTAGQFYITGQQNTSTHNIDSYATPVALTIANMKTAAQWGLYGWSQMLGGSFSISSTAMSTLSASTTVVYYTQDVVYPSQFAALNGLKCISNCPTASDISASNASPGSYVSPYRAISVGNGAYSTGVPLISYTLNATSGNLVDDQNADVVSAATTGFNSNGVGSGRMVSGNDVAALDAAVTARNGTGGSYIQSDIDALTTYYQWQTGPQNWQQLTVLKDSGGAPVVFDPPLNVTYTVPSDAAKYGTSAGATIVLQFGGFGNLWGIPSTCIDISTNAACLANNATPQALQRWTPEFSIPDVDPATSQPSFVTVQGSSTQYLVKALNKEVRLGQVPGCTGVTLTLPTLGAVTLPVVGGWQDVSPTGGYYIGAIPTFTTMPAPQVIQGMKMY